MKKGGSDDNDNDEKKLIIEKPEKKTEEAKLLEMSVDTYDNVRSNCTVCENKRFQPDSFRSLLFKPRMELSPRHFDNDYCFVCCYR